MTYETQTCEVSPGARLFVYSDGVYEVRGADGRVRTHDEFLAPFVAPESRTLDAIVAHARGERGEDLFDDDVSLVRMDFP